MNGDSGLGKKANRTLRGRRHHGELRRVLRWVAEKRGKLAVVVDETGTTRTCHGCGHVEVGGIHPSVRTWDCRGCGTHHLRDENAAQNGLTRLIAVSGFHQVPSSGRSMVTSRRRWSCLPGGRWVERDWTVPRDHAIKPIRANRGSGAGHPSRIDPASDLPALT